MQNPFMSGDGVEGDEADREHAGGREKADGEKATRGAGYRDDPSLLAASSDYAQRGTTNQYSGQGPGDESSNLPSGRESRGMQGGSQAQWKGAAEPSDPDHASDAPRRDTPEGGEAYGDVPSRSADPGQSSYGGFKNEGPSPHDAPQQKASDRDDSDGDGDGRKP